MIVCCFHRAGQNIIITSATCDDLPDRIRGLSADSISLSLHGIGCEDLQALAGLLPVLRATMSAAAPSLRTTGFIIPAELPRQEIHVNAAK